MDGVEGRRARARDDRPGRTGRTDRLVAVAPDDVWAFGAVSRPSGGDTGFLAEFRDGKRWTLFSMPGSPEGTQDSMVVHGASAISPTDIWVVGEDHCGPGCGDEYVARWDGQQWHSVPYPSAPCAGDDSLDGVAAVAPNSVWIVGAEHRARRTLGRATGAARPTPRLPRADPRLERRRLVARERLGRRGWIRAVERSQMDRGLDARARRPGRCRRAGGDVAEVRMGDRPPRSQLRDRRPSRLYALARSGTGLRLARADVGDADRTPARP